MTSIGSYSAEPVFTIKSVQTRTNIKPVTLRAWERRYDLLAPVRMPNGYRLYSERDIQLLFWVQRKLDSGMSISQVVQQFKQARQNDTWPETIQSIASEAPRLKAPRPARDYAEIMFGALVSSNEQRANAIFEDSQKYFDLLTIFQEIITPAVALLEEAWYRGEIRIATVHAASTYLKGKLLALMQIMPMSKEGALILVGCGPEETHELNLLMFAVLLRQAGYFVEYLGPDLPTDDVIDYSTSVRPKLVILSITNENTAYLLKDFAQALGSLRGRPKFGYTGQYMQDNETLRAQFGGIYLGPTLEEGIKTVKQLIAVP